MSYQSINIQKEYKDYNEMYTNSINGKFAVQNNLLWDTYVYMLQMENWNLYQPLRATSMTLMATVIKGQQSKQTSLPEQQYRTSS